MTVQKTRNWIARFLHRGRYGDLPVREGGEQRSASQGDASPHQQTKTFTIAILSTSYCLPTTYSSASREFR